MITKKDKHTPLIHLFLGYPEPILLLFFWVFFFFCCINFSCLQIPHNTHTHRKAILSFSICPGLVLWLAELLEDKDTSFESLFPLFSDLLTEM